VSYLRHEYIETLTGNKVSRKSVLCGSQNIRLYGKTIIKPGSIIRGDLACVNIGRFSCVGSNTVIRPACKPYKGNLVFFPTTIGDHVFIDDDCVIEAASIGSSVVIGKSSIIGKRCILKDCCVVEANSVVPADTVIAPFSVYAGHPARCVGALPDCFHYERRDDSMSCYDNFVAAD